jgi:hypothetical protein
MALGLDEPQIANARFQHSRGSRNVVWPVVSNRGSPVQGYESILIPREIHQEQSDSLLRVTPAINPLTC